MFKGQYLEPSVRIHCAGLSDGMALVTCRKCWPNAVLASIIRRSIAGSCISRFTRRKRSFNGRSMPARLIKVQGQWTYLSTALLNAGVTQSNSGSASIAIFLPPTPV